jgi:hypothetical protein
VKNHGASWDNRSTAQSDGHTDLLLFLDTLWI